jgi:hypothetical protein
LSRWQKEIIERSNAYVPKDNSDRLFNGSCVAACGDLVDFDAKHKKDGYTVKRFSLLVQLSDASKSIPAGKGTTKDIPANVETWSWNGSVDNFGKYFSCFYFTS